MDDYAGSAEYAADKTLNTDEYHGIFMGVLIF